MKRLPWGRVAALAAATTLAAGGCTGSGEAGEYPDTVQIALMAPITGSRAEAGKAAQQGAQLAVDMVNETHPASTLPLAEGQGLPGLGDAKLELRVADSATSGGGSNGAIGELVDGGAAAIVSAGDSARSVKAASESTERLHVPFVSGDAAPGDLTERGLDWFFRTGPTDQDIGEAFLTLLEQRPGGGRSQHVGVIHPDDDDGKATAEDIDTAVRAGGHESTLVPVPAGGYDAGAVKSALYRVPDAVDGLVLVGHTEAQANAATRALEASGLEPDGVLGVGDGFTDPQALSGLSERVPGLFVASDWTAANLADNPDVRYVFDLYADRYGETMTDEAAAAFTATYVVARGLDEAGSVDRSRLRTALEGLRLPGRELVMQWDGVRFDATHQNQSARAVITQMNQGEERLVYPADLAHQPPTWNSGKEGR